VFLGRRAQEAPVRSPNPQVTLRLRDWIDGHQHAGIAVEPAKNYIKRAADELQTLAGAVLEVEQSIA